MAEVPDLLSLARLTAVCIGAIALAIYGVRRAKRRSELRPARAPKRPQPRPTRTPATTSCGDLAPASATKAPAAKAGELGRSSPMPSRNETLCSVVRTDTVYVGRGAERSAILEERDLAFLARLQNDRAFAVAPGSHFMFQPIRRLLPEGVPAWYCPQLVISGHDGGSIYTANTDVELVVLQPLDSDENDPDDSLRAFLLPLSADTFQVLQVPVSAREIASRVLSWNEVRLLLGRGYRSVGRDDLVDYGRRIPVQPWSNRCRFPEHDRVFYSVAVSPYDARLVADYATGYILLHVRKLRPRGAVQTSYAYRGGVSPLNVCLTFIQRYGGYVCAERQIYGRLLPFDEEMERPPQQEAVVDVTAAGTIVNIYAPYKPQPERLTQSAADVDESTAITESLLVSNEEIWRWERSRLATDSDPPSASLDGKFEEASGVRIVERRRFIHLWRDYLRSKQQDGKLTSWDDWQNLVRTPSDAPPPKAAPPRAPTGGEP